MGSITASNTIYESDGSYGRVDCDAAFSSSYNNTGSDTTTGETLTAAAVGFSQIMGVDTPAEAAGYGFQVLGLASGPAQSVRIKVFQGGSGTTGATAPAFTGTPGTVPAETFTGTPGTVPAQTFTGTPPAAAENLGTPVFSGTGQSSAGQVITTTDNQTMTLNQCAGMWFISATHGPYLIASNTAVSGAPAVLTIYGTAPTTDAGTYKILTGVTPAGTNGTAAFTPAGTNGTAAFTPAGTVASHTHTIGAGAGAEVPNATNLSVSLASVRFTVYGK